MRRRIKTGLKSGYILTIGVDPAMSKNAGIAIVRFFPEKQLSEPIITRTFKGMRHLDVADYLSTMRGLLEPDIVHAIGSESSFRGKFAGIPYGVGRARGIVEGIAAVLWPGIIIESFKAKEWRKTAFGHGGITKQDALITADADFKNPRFPNAAIIGKLTEDAAEAYHIARATAIKLTSE